MGKLINATYRFLTRKMPRPLGTYTEHAEYRTPGQGKGSHEEKKPGDREAPKDKTSADMHPRGLKSLTDLELFNERRRRKGNPPLTQEEFDRKLKEIRARKKKLPDKHSTVNGGSDNQTGSNDDTPQSQDPDD